MTLIQLRSFLAVARSGGFTAAARMLNSSQTTISSQVQALEDEHGVKLFERRGRRVDLTDIGHEFLKVARQMIDLEDDAALLLKDSSALRSGALRIGAVSPFQVMEMIGVFNRRYPDIYMSITLGNSEEILRNLAEHVCDVGVLAKIGDDDRYYVQHYGSFPVIAFVHREHHLAAFASITLEELGREKLLMREPGSTTRRAVEDAFAKVGIRPRTAMEIGSREAIREGVIRGLGVGVVSQSEYVPDALLHPLPLSGSPVLTHIYLCCLRERRRNRIISALFDTLRNKPMQK